MRPIGRGVMLLVVLGCAVAMPTSPGAAETPGEQPIATPQPETPPIETASVPSATPLGVRDVRVEPIDNGRRVVVTLTRAAEGLRDLTLSSPPRVVLDLRGPLGRATERRYPIANDDVVRRARVAPYDGQLRVVLDLKERATVKSVRQDGDAVIAELITTRKTIAKPATKAASEPVLAPMIDTAAADAGEPRADTAEPVGPVARPIPDPIQPIAYQPPPRPQPARLAAARTETPPMASGPRADTVGPGAEPQTFSGQKISLDFKDADIQNVLRVLADVSGLNIIATDDVQGKVTLHLTDVPWDQAFDLVLRTNRLEKTVDGNVVRVSSVTRLKEERDSLKAAADSEQELEPLQVKYIRVNYARADEALVDKVKGVLTDRGAATFDDRTNTIIVRDIERGVGDATYLVRELDVQSPQVLIEANIVEATQDFARGLGVQWGYRGVQGPASGTPTGMNFPNSVGVGGSGLGAGLPAPSAGTGAVPLPVPFMADFPVPSGFGGGFGTNSGSALDIALGSLNGEHSLTARLTALENEGKGKVISRPRVITMNNVAATIQSLTILRVKLPSTGTVIATGSGGVAGGGTTATEKINTGITLVVTPQVSSDGYVLMSIYAKSSVPDFSRQVDGIPSEIAREANSNVLIRNGDTVVLGGIYRHTADDRQDGLPYLKDVPAIGWLFRRDLNVNHHEELLVFITPKVIESGTAALPPAERLWSERRGG